MNNVQEMAAVAALNKMLKDSHFSICTIDRIGEMLNRNVKCESYNILHTLHCVDYSGMSSELRAELPQLIQDCLGVTPIYHFTNLQQKEIDVSVPKRGFLKVIGLQK